MVTAHRNTEVGEKQLQTSFWDHRRAVAISCIIMTTAFQFGLDYAIIGPFQTMPGFLQVFGYPDPSLPIGYNIDPVVQQIIGSFMTLGGFLGNMMVGPLSHYLGRRHCLAIACFMSVFSFGLMFIPALGSLYFARILIGIAIGMLGAFSQIYVIEILPLHLRGTIIAFYSFWISFAGIIGAIIDNATAYMDGRACYYIPLGICCIVPTLVFPVLFFIPESPRWLLNKNRFEEAEHALQRLRRGAVSQEMIDAEFKDMRDAAIAEHELIKSAEFIDLFRGTNLRRTLISIGIQVCQPATGVSFLLSYGTYFFLVAQGGSTDPFVDGIGLSCCGMAGVMVSMVCLRWCPRRIMLFIAVASMGVSIFLVALFYTVAPDALWSQRGLLAFTFIYQFMYFFAVSPLPFLISGEVPTQRLRAYTFGVGNAISYFGSWLVNFTSPYFLNTTALNWG